MKSAYDIIVIGAGPAGLTAAYLLAKGGKSVCVLEAADQVGGMARTIPLWGQSVDIGPHRFFSKDRRINELWLEIAGGEYDMVDRLTRIYYKRKFYNYPLKPFNAFLNLGPFESFRCLMSYFRERLAPAPLADNFESWVISRFGKRLFDIFFKTYSEKLWGVSCTEIHSDFAAQRIKKFSLMEALKTAFLGNSGKHATLADQFAFPHGGTGRIYEKDARPDPRRWRRGFIARARSTLSLPTATEPLSTWKMAAKSRDRMWLARCRSLFSSIAFPTRRKPSSSRLRD